VDMTIDRTGIGFNGVDAAFAERVRINQRKLAAELKSHYDFNVCGSGSSGFSQFIALVCKIASPSEFHIAAELAGTWPFIELCGRRNRGRTETPGRSFLNPFRKTLGECS